MRQPTSVLHPKSRFTTSLFATTVFASFFVVLLPHILPCPAPRNSFLDDGSTASPQRRRRRKVIVEENSSEVSVGSTYLQEGGREKKRGVEELESRERLGEKERRERNQRACPIPKPGELVGEILGFKIEGSEGEEEAKACSMPRTPSETLGFKKVLPSRIGSERERVGRTRGDGGDFGSP